MTTTRLQHERLTERISDAFCAVDPDWRITYCNDRMADWVGTRASRLEGAVLWEGIPTLLGTRVETECRDAMATGESRSFEVRLDEPVVRWVEVDVYADDHGLSLLSREVTDRKQREAELELAETLFENTQDALFLIDVTNEATFRLERVNPAYEADTGLSNAALRGRDLRDAFGPETGGEILARYRNCVRRREAIEYEERVPVSGEEIDWETRIAPVIVDGTIEKLVGATRNITRRKAREREYEAIFNGAYQFIGLLDPDGTLLEANESSLRFGGLEREAVVGLPVWETPWWQRDDDTPTRLREGVAAAAAGEFVRYDVEVQGIGETAIIDFSIRPIRDDEGTVTQLVAEGRNITAHKRRERELARNREFLAQIQRVAAIGGWEVDLRTDTVQVTDEVATLYGFTLDQEPTIAAGIEAYHEADRPSIAAAWDRLTTAGEPYDLELRFVTADDEVRWVRTVGEPRYEDGEIVGACGALQDITDRKERERELERTNERLDAFAAVVSHDLRNPLSVAQLSLDLGRHGDDPAAFDRVAAAHDRMNALIDDLLTLAREGRTVETVEPVPVASVLASVWDSLPGDDATLAVTLDGYELEADAARLHQLLENLLSNALRHGGGDVTITVGVLADRDGIYIEDDGPGIPADRRETIFDHGVTTGSDGTGFGLTIVEEIAAAHGWRVEATEGTDGGARFELLTGVAQPKG